MLGRLSVEELLMKESHHWPTDYKLLTLSMCHTMQQVWVERPRICTFEVPCTNLCGKVERLLPSARSKKPTVSVV